MLLKEKSCTKITNKAFWPKESFGANFGWAKKIFFGKNILAKNCSLGQKNISLAKSVFLGKYYFFVFSMM